MSKKTTKPAQKSKSEIITTLLRRNSRASIAELAKATSWQHHSVHGFISGTLRKKRGLEVMSIKDENKAARYKITGQPQ